MKLQRPHRRGDAHPARAGAHVRAVLLAAMVGRGSVGCQPRPAGSRRSLAQKYSGDSGTGGIGRTCPIKHRLGAAAHTPRFRSDAWQRAASLQFSCPSCDFAVHWWCASPAVADCSCLRSPPSAPRYRRFRATAFASASSSRFRYSADRLGTSCHGKCGSITSGNEWLDAGRASSAHSAGPRGHYALLALHVAQHHPVEAAALPVTSYRVRQLAWVGRRDL